MANPKGIITRKDVFSDDAMNFGDPLVGEFTKVTKASDVLLNSVIQLNKEIKNLKVSQTEKDYITAKQAATLETQKAISAIKQQEVLEVSLQKIKQQVIATSKTGLELDVKKAKASREIASLLATEEKLNREKLETDKKAIEVQTTLEKLSQQKIVTSKQKSATQAQELKLLQEEEKLVQQKANTLRAQNALIEQNQRIVKGSLDIKSKEIAAIKKEELEKQRSVKLTLEERIQLQANTKELRYAAMERLGLISAYTKLNKSRTDAKNRLLDLIATERSSTSEIKKAQREYDILDKKVRRADAAVGDFTKNVGNYKSAFSGFAGGIGNLLGAFGIIGGLSLFATIAKDIYSTTKEMQSLNNALKQVTDTNENLIEQQTFLTRISEAYGVELMGLTKQYTQFYVAAKDKLASSEIQGIFESITKAGASMGLSVQSQERAFLALNQMMSKGTIQAEELRGQLGEALPGALGIMAKSLNVSEKQLGDMMKKGELLASEVLPKFAKQLEKTYGIENKDRIDSLAASQNRFSNSWTELIVSIDSGGGRFTKFLSGTLDILNAMVATMTKFNETYASVRDKAAGDSQKADSEIYKGLDPARTKAIAEENKKIAQAAIDDLNNKLKTSKNYLEKLDEISFQNVFRIGKISGVRKEIDEYNVALGVQRGRVLAANAALQSLVETKNEVADADETEADKAKRLAAQKKAEAERIRMLKELYEAEKKLIEDAYKLRQFRFQVEMDLLDDIVTDEKESYDDRLEAQLQFNQTKAGKTKEATQYDLQQLGTYNEQTGKFIRQISDSEIKSLLETGETKKKLTDEQRLIYEKFQNEMTVNAKKGEDDRRKLIDSEVAAIQKLIDAQIQIQANDQNTDTIAANDQYATDVSAANGNYKLLEDARIKHENRLLAIQREYALKGINANISHIEEILKNQDRLEEDDKLSAEIRKKYADDLLDFKRKASDLAVDTELDNNQKILDAQKELNQQLTDLAYQIKDAVLDLTNALFDAKIRRIDEEISKSNEYYAGEIEKAGNDQNKKDLINQEAERKRQELEKKKRKEQTKQAIFNKAITIAEIAIQTALSIVKASPVIPLMVMAGIAGALALATAIATPIPKYKLGRKGGPAEWAETGDGFVNEIVEKKDGRVYMTPNVPTLTYLEKGDTVHSSVDEYLKLQKAAMMSSIDMQGRKVSNFQATQYFDNAYSKELLEELKETTKAVKNNKNRTVINMPKLDINYHLWKMKNTNWN